MSESGRFDYIKYDLKAMEKQMAIKARMESLEKELNRLLPSSRYLSTALTNLEIAYAMIGKAIRDDQLERNKNAILQEGRTNS